MFRGARSLRAHGAWIILAAAATPLATSPAYAADKAERDAQARFAEGLTRVKRGDFEAARLSFAEAYVVLHKPDILWNLALSEEKSGHVLDALGHFKELGRILPPDSDRMATKRHIDALMAQTGHIEVVAPSGARVYVDGRVDAGVAPLADAIDVTPGKHHVTAGDQATDTDAAAGQLTHVSFVETNAPRVASPPGEAAVPSSAGQDSPSPPAVSMPPPEQAPEKQTHATQSPARAITAAAIGAAAVGSGIAGIVFGVQSESNANSAASLSGASTSGCYAMNTAQCTQLKDAVDAQNRNETLSIVFYATGGGLAAAAVAAWFLWPKTPSPAAAWVVPTLAPAGWGPGLVGRF